MNTLEKERIRNLKFHILNYMSENTNFNLRETIDEKDLKEKFYFKKSDILNYSNIFLKNKQFKDEIIEELNGYFEQHRAVGKVDVETLEFKNIYETLSEYFSGKYNEDIDTTDLINRGAALASKIHWAYLPVYKETYMNNSGMIPEENLEEYYRHYHMIEDLYREITNSSLKVDWRSIPGDINLNKAMKMSIYTARWGHEENYTVKRTESGWIFEHFSYNNIVCKPNGHSLDGEDIKINGFYSILEQDSIQYPREGVEYALEQLWEEADTTNMSIEKLKVKINEIGKWISEVEKAVHEFQPSWVGYY